MDVRTDRRDGALIAEVEGRIDSATARDFEEMMNAAITEQDEAVIVDLARLSYISSAGLRAILLIAKSLWKRKAAFAVCALDDSIAEVFKIAGFDKIIDVRDSVSEALAANAG